MKYFCDTDCFKDEEVLDWCAEAMEYFKFLKENKITIEPDYAL